MWGLSWCIEGVLEASERGSGPGESRSRSSSASIHRAQCRGDGDVMDEPFSFDF